MNEDFAETLFKRKTNAYRVKSLEHLDGTIGALNSHVVAHMDMIQGQTILGGYQEQLLNALSRCSRTCERTELFAQLAMPNSPPALSHARKRIRFMEIHLHMLSSATTYDNSTLRINGTDISSYTSTLDPDHEPDQTVMYHSSQLVKALLIREHCAAPGCRRAYAECGRLLFCSGCQRVRYCSVDCQTKAWKQSAVPHREVCQVISSVFTGMKVALRAQPPWKFDSTRARSSPSSRDHAGALQRHHEMGNAT
jgi:hypothetical protein